MSMYQVQVPEGVETGASFQVNLGGQMTTVQCPDGVGPGAVIQVQGPPQGGAPVSSGTGVAPPGQHMGDEISRILGPQQGFLMRQKLDMQEIFCPALQKRNKYKVAALPTDRDQDDPTVWEDKTFKKALKSGKLLTIKEESECFARFCCGPFREFSAKVTSSGQTGSKAEVASFHRPFKCTLNCGCFMLNPQEISSFDAKEQLLGKTVFDFRCMDQFCGKRHWEIQDASGKRVYVMEDNMCCNANMFAPSICCPVRRIDIYNADETQVVGNLQNLFPGCNMRGCFGTADNYKLVFPEDATPAMKMQLMASAVLVDFMLFEKAEDDNQGAFE